MKSSVSSSAGYIRSLLKVNTQCKRRLRFRQLRKLKWLAFFVRQRRKPQPPREITCAECADRPAIQVMKTQVTMAPEMNLGQGADVDLWMKMEISKQSSVQTGSGMDQDSAKVQCTSGAVAAQSLLALPPSLPSHVASCSQSVGVVEGSNAASATGKVVPPRVPSQGQSHGEFPKPHKHDEDLREQKGSAAGSLHARAEALRNQLRSATLATHWTATSLRQHLQSNTRSSQLQNAKLPAAFVRPPSCPPPPPPLCQLPRPSFPGHQAQDPNLRWQKPSMPRPQMQLPHWGTAQSAWDMPWKARIYLHKL